MTRSRPGGARAARRHGVCWFAGAGRAASAPGSVPAWAAAGSAMAPGSTGAVGETVGPLPGAGAVGGRAAARGRRRRRARRGAAGAAVRAGGPAERRTAAGLPADQAGQRLAGGGLDPGDRTEGERERGDRARSHHDPPTPDPPQPGPDLTRRTAAPPRPGPARTGSGPARAGSGPARAGSGAARARSSGRWLALVPGPPLVRVAGPVAPRMPGLPSGPVAPSHDPASGLGRLPAAPVPRPETRRAGPAAPGPWRAPAADPSAPSGPGPPRRWVGASHALPGSAPVDPAGPPGLRRSGHRDRSSRAHQKAASRTGRCPPTRPDARRSRGHARPGCPAIASWCASTAPRSSGPSSAARTCSRCRPRWPPRRRSASRPCRGRTRRTR